MIYKMAFSLKNCSSREKENELYFWSLRKELLASGSGKERGNTHPPQQRIIWAKWTKPVVITYSRTFAWPFFGLSTVYLPPPDPARLAWHRSTAVQAAYPYMVIHICILPVPQWRVGSTFKEAALYFAHPQYCTGSSFAAHQKKGLGVSSFHKIRSKEKLFGGS